MSRQGDRDSGSRPETAIVTGGTGGTGMLSGSATLMGQNSQMGSAPMRGNVMSSERRTYGGNGLQGRGGGLSRGDIDFAFKDGSGMTEERKTWAPNQGGQGRGQMGPSPSMKSVMTRKNALTYDPEHPERPPKFTTWLEESFRSVSPFPQMEDGEKGNGRQSILGNIRNSMGGAKRMSLMQRRRSKSMGEISDIGTAF